MYRIAVLGDYDSIYGFAALGLDTFPEEDPEEAAKSFMSWLAAVMRWYISQKSWRRSFPL